MTSTPRSAGRDPAAGDQPEFDITFTDDGVRPEAKVIPEGDVRIEVWNRGTAPHDFVLLQLTEDNPGTADSRAGSTERAGSESPAAPSSPEVGAARHLAPDEHASIAATLGSGVYVLLDECCRASASPRLLELTVQPGG